MSSAGVVEAAGAGIQAEDEDGAACPDGMAKGVDPCDGADGVGKDGMEKFCPPAAPAFEVLDAAGGVDEADGLGAAEPDEAGGVIGTEVAGAALPEAGALPPL